MALPNDAQVNKVKAEWRGAVPRGTHSLTVAPLNPGAGQKAGWRLTPLARGVLRAPRAQNLDTLTGSSKTPANRPSPEP